MMTNFPYCSNILCANNKRSPSGKQICIVLTEAMNDRPDGCPFFVTSGDAEVNAKKAYERAMQMDTMPKGYYTGRRFEYREMVMQEDGTCKEEMVPDIGSWLQHLAKQGIVTQEWADRYCGM